MISKQKVCYKCMIVLVYVLSDLLLAFKSPHKFGLKNVNRHSLTI